jgi:hypothetical protein
MTAADAWVTLGIAGATGALEAIRAAGPAVAPMLRPARARLDRDGEGAGAEVGPGVQTDAFAVLQAAAAPSTGGASVFAGVVAATAGLLRGGRRRWPVRLGITVDVRRQEGRLGAPGTAGNLSLVGWVNVPGGLDVTADAAHGQIQCLLRRRFWRQQLAFDAWLSPRSPAAVARACDVLIGRVANRAPLTLSELWRDDGPICRACSHPRRRLPDWVSPIAIPPALPPAGVTVGITRTENETLAVLRRVTRGETSAPAWIERMAPRVRGFEKQMSGPITMV